MRMVLIRILWYIPDKDDSTNLIIDASKAIMKVLMIQRR